MKGPAFRAAGLAAPRPFRNWSGSVRFTPRSFAEPESLEQLRSTLQCAAERGGALRVRGSGHSFVPLVESDDLLLSLDKLSGVGPTEGDSALVWAGTTLDVLGRALSARGLALYNLGDINKQTLGGALATGTHGTGAALGSISTQVKELTLVLESGVLLACSEIHERDLFDAARVSLGALGVVAQVKLRVRPAYRLKLRKYMLDLDACLARAAELAERSRHFEFYWFPHTRACGLKEMNETDEPESKRGLHALGELLIENGTLAAISGLSRRVPALTPRLSRLMAWSVRGDAGTMVADCHRAFSSPRFVRFHELEYALPREHGPAALRELAEYVDKQRVHVHFPVEYRYVRGDEIWLSPFYRRDSVAISVHQYVGMDYARYFAAAEAIFRSYGGRPHWGKMHGLGARELAPLYPRWDDFQRVRALLDPRGRFLNDYLRRLFIP